MVCTPDSCIDTARVIQLLLRDSGLPARPVPVQVRVCNPAAWALAQRSEWDALMRGDDGAWLVNVGDPTTPIKPGRWAGHVAVLSGTRLIDASIDQANRPEHGIVLEPVAFDVPPHFLSPGGIAHWTTPNGIHLQYIHHPDNRSYRSTPNWRDAHELVRLARAGMRLARAGEPGGPRPPL
jgi:hypothetical protein